MTMPFVYIAENAINGKSYIGVTGRKTIAKRAYEHGWFARSGKNTVFAKAIRKYGIEAFRFSALGEYATYAEALDAERAFIERLKPDYNTAAGGRGPMNTKWSDERRERAVKGMRAAWNSTRKAHMSAMWKGRPLTEETKEKIRAAKPAEHFCKPIMRLNDGVVFASLRDAAKASGARAKTISEVLSGRQHVTGAGLWTFAYASDVLDDGSRVRLLNAVMARRQANIDRRKRDGTGNRKAVRCLNDEKVYPSGLAAAKVYGLSVVTVSNLCLGKLKATKTGLRFEFVGGA